MEVFMEVTMASSHLGFILTEVMCGLAIILQQSTRIQISVQILLKVMLSEEDLAEVFSMFLLKINR